MKKLYIILIAALLLTLAACLTACSAKPVSLRGTEAPNLPGPTNDALKVTDEGQDWNITLEQVDKENFAEDDRLLAKGSYQVFQLNQEGSGDTPPPLPPRASTHILSSGARTSCNFWET